MVSPKTPESLPWTRHLKATKDLNNGTNAIWNTAMPKNLPTTLKTLTNNPTMAYQIIKISKTQILTIKKMWSLNVTFTISKITAQDKSPKLNTNIPINNNNILRNWKILTLKKHLSLTKISRRDTENEQLTIIRLSFTNMIFLINLYHFSNLFG